MGMLLSNALTCIKSVQYKNKWLFYQGDEYLYEQFILLTHITLGPNTQLVCTWQHAYQLFLSYFLVLLHLQYCAILGEF